MRTMEKGTQKDKIAKAALDKYDELKKTGKPIPSQEWTVYTAIVMLNTKEEIVVALGTGSKCIGKTSLSSNGDTINDSHAEVIARRCFLKFLYSEMRKSVYEESICLNYKKDMAKFILKDDITFHMFTTCLPCGDATIFQVSPKYESNKFKKEIKVTPPLEKRLKTETDTYSVDVNDDNNEERETLVNFTDLNRTGAKCLPLGFQDPKLLGTQYHVIGVLRTKPGRGDPTLSMSCSDKIAKWNLLGVQGSLLSWFLEKPIYFSSIIFGKCRFNLDSVERAIYGRFKNDLLDFVFPIGYRHNCPVIDVVDINRKELMKDDSIKPCSGSILWYYGCKNQEVAVEGKKQGVTKKLRNIGKANLSVCKRELYHDYVNLKTAVSTEKFETVKLTYSEAKNLSVEYCKLWKDVRDRVFKIWSQKPKHFEGFSICEQ
ncbi:tRNA-specific adenosine deaminase 1-like isoform X2 [Artemia franciscana]